MPKPQHRVYLMHNSLPAPSLYKLPGLIETREQGIHSIGPLPGLYFRGLRRFGGRLDSLCGLLGGF